MARPLRFRHSPETWHERRVRDALYTDLDANIGAEMRASWYRPPEGYDARRFEMDNGDVALFCWRPGEGGAPPSGGSPPRGGGFWIGNTETPSTLWKTEKYGFDSAPEDVSEWAERELLAQLHEEAPWLREYPRVSWFFLPVLLSKDGRHTTREFLGEHAAGFPDASREVGLGFYERFLARGVLDPYREVMAAKLGTSKQLDHGRMCASMAEFTAAWLLDEAGYAVTPEVEVTTGHSIDFRAGEGEGATLVEVTRPLPPARRNAGTGAAALRETAETKAAGQLSQHGGGVTLFVDCSSFDDAAWESVCETRPAVHHRPAVVYRVRPDGAAAAYAEGSVPIDLDGAVTWVS